MKFRRQHPVGHFLVDFYCHEAKMVIEVDGGYQLDPDQYMTDCGRHHELEDLGLPVLRCSNEEVEKDIETVLRIITAKLQTSR